MRIRLLLGLLVMVFNLLDNFTTFLCLRAPVRGYEVVEANPLARWLFEEVGLVEGLLIETLLTLGAVGFLVLSSRIPAPIRLGLLGVLAILPAWASLHNFEVIQALGIV